MQLQCGIDEYCLNNDLQYQCTVTDSVLLRWRIRDEEITSLGTVTYTTGDDPVTIPLPFPNSLPFFIDLSSTSPSLISNISFTVQSSINGYTIHCEDINGNSENFTVLIPGELVGHNINLW